MIFFPCGASSLEKAEASLSQSSLEVEAGADFLRVWFEDSPKYVVRFSDAPHVQVEAAEIGAGRPEEEAMRMCGARFEVVIEDLEEALDEINTLMELQSILQEASGGYLYLPWNDMLSEPWSEE